MVVVVPVVTQLGESGIFLEKLLRAPTTIQQ